jgi:hypothetical protein
MEYKPTQKISCKWFLTLSLLLVLSFYPTQLVFAGTEKQNIRVPIGLSCARLLDFAFPSIRDPVEIAFRNVNFGLITGENRENFTSTPESQTLYKFLDLVTVELTKLSEENQIHLLRAMTANQEEYRLGIPSAVWESLSRQGLADAFSNSVKLWVVDKLLSKKEFPSALFGLTYILTNESETDAVTHIRLSLLNGFTSESSKWITKRTVISALQNERDKIEGRLKSQIFNDIVQHSMSDMPRLSTDEIETSRAKLNNIAVNLEWLRRL